MDEVPLNMPDPTGALQYHEMNHTRDAYPPAFQASYRDLCCTTPTRGLVRWARQGQREVLGRRLQCEPQEQVLAGLRHHKWAG